MGEFNVNKSDGSLNPTAGMPETYPAEQVMLSDGVTSVEDALDGLTSGLTSKPELVSISLSGSTDANGNIAITGTTYSDYPIAFIAGKNSNDVVTFFDGSSTSGYQKYAHFATKTSASVTGAVVCIRGTYT